MSKVEYCKTNLEQTQDQFNMSCPYCKSLLFFFFYLEYKQDLMRELQLDNIRGSTYKKYLFE